MLPQHAALCGGLADCLWLEKWLRGCGLRASAAFDAQHVLLCTLSDMV
jgi:hypothetical protein